MAQKESFREIIQDRKPVLIDFSAEWCGPCKMLAPVLKQFSGLVKDQVRILKIDVDKNPAIASQYNIRGVPTLILFREGRQLWRQSGVLPLNRLREAVEQHAGLVFS